MPPITIEAEGKSWLAIGYNAASGAFVWIPEDTEIKVAPLFEPDVDPAPAPAPAASALVLPV